MNIACFLLPEHILNIWLGSTTAGGLFIASLQFNILPNMHISRKLHICIKCTTTHTFSQDIREGLISQIVIEASSQFQIDMHVDLQVICLRRQSIVALHILAC